jgi:hypothetical protein
MSIGINVKVTVLFILSQLLITGCLRKNSRVYDSLSVAASPVVPANNEPTQIIPTEPQDPPVSGKLQLVLTVEGEANGTTEFGTLKLGSVLTTKAVIVNVGDLDATLERVNKEDILPFLIVDDKQCLKLIKAKADCSFKIAFSPEKKGSKNETLKFEYINKLAKQEQDLSHKLKGSGTADGGGNVAFHDIYGDGIDFGKIPVGSTLIKHVVITNKGELTVRLPNFGIQNPGIFQVVPATRGFTESTRPCSGLLLPGRDCTVDVRFAPPQVQNYENSLYFDYLYSENAPAERKNLNLVGQGVKPTPELCYIYNDQDVFPQTGVNSQEITPQGIVINGDFVPFPYLFKTKTPRVGDHVLIDAPLKYLYGTDSNQSKTLKDGTVLKYIQNGQVLVRFEFEAKNLELLDSFYSHVNVNKLIVSSEARYQDTELFCYVIKDTRSCSGTRYYQPHWQGLINGSFWNKSAQELEFDAQVVSLSSIAGLEDFSKKLRNQFQILSSGEKELYLKRMLDLSELFARPVVGVSTIQSWQELLAFGVYNMQTADDVRHVSLPWLTIRTKEEVSCHP